MILQSFVHCYFDIILIKHLDTEFYEGLCTSSTIFPFTALASSSFSLCQIEKDFQDVPGCSFNEELRILLHHSHHLQWIIGCPSNAVRFSALSYNLQTVHGDHVDTRYILKRKLLWLNQLISIFLFIMNGTFCHANTYYFKRWGNFVLELWRIGKATRRFRQKLQPALLPRFISCNSKRFQWLHQITGLWNLFDSIVLILVFSLFSRNGTY